MLSIGVLSSCSDNGISSKLDDLQSQIDDLKSEVAGLKTQISDLRTEMQEADAAIRAEYNQQISDINDEIDALTTQLEELTAQFEADKETIQSDYNTKITNLKDYTDGKVAELEAANAALGAQLEELNNRHDEDKEDFEEAIEALQVQISANKTAMETFASNYLTEKAALELDYNTKISNLTTTYQAKVAEIEDSITACNNAISALETEMAAVLLETQNDYNSKINALTNRVAALEAITYHTVTFDTGAGSAVAPQVIAHNEKITKPVDPTKPGYTFEGWTYNGNPWVFYGYVVSEDMTLTANWEAIDYTVTFKNDDGSVLEIQTPVHYGDSITYHGGIPVKPNPTDHYIYTFDGWDVDLTNIIGDTVAVAQYTSEYAPFTAYFYGDEDNLLYSTLVREGETANYVGETPTKEDDNVNKLQFQFSGWDEIGRTENTISYKVHFQSCTKGLVFEENSVYHYTGLSPSVTVPSYWNGHNITTISHNAFKDSSLIDLTISDGITTVQDGAFSNCTNLVSVSLPDTITCMGEDVVSSGFDGSVYYGSLIGVFSNCISLKTIRIPRRLSYVAINCFASCRELRSVELNTGLKRIGNNAFSSCLSLESIDLTDSVVAIGKEAFMDCRALENISIPNQVTSISVSAFENCYSLSRVSLPNGLATIGNAAFRECHSLTSVNIPKNVKTIKNGAFISCLSLKTIIIPKETKTMGKSVFDNCPSLTILVEETYKSKDWASDWEGTCTVIWGFESFLEIEGYHFALSLVEGEKEAYLYSVDSEIDSFEIPELANGYNFVGMQLEVFKNNSFVSIIFPSCFTTVDSNLFKGCSSLTSINLPNSLTTIGASAFKGCSSLTSINLPNSLTTIGASAFNGCSSLTSINLPNSLTTISYKTFAYCSSLTSVVIPEGVESIEEYAFAGCSMIEAVFIPTSVSIIEARAFDECNSLILYCEAVSKPTGWNDQWNYHDIPVVWNYNPS